MVKTTVYLNEPEAEALRRAASASGKSQSELIREGVRLVAERTGTARRVFHSRAAGHGGGGSFERWDADELYRRKVGREG